MTIEARATETLQRVFGFDGFRPPQLDVIQSVTGGNDCLVIMPTGGGKSLCYQLPALMMEGTTIVISPLIALMQDQVNAAKQLGVQAEYLNSTLSYEQQSQVIQRLQASELDLLYMAPERLQQTDTVDMLKAAKISLVAVDEAHCVSQWGHDFRPDYLSLSIFKEILPSTPVLALTATANDMTRDEIVERLGLESPDRFVKGFDRPNIYYQVSLKTNPRTQLKQFLESRRDQCGIVYCLSRKKVEQTAAWLCDQGFDARPYHAGLETDERAENQEYFLNSDSSIIVATIAFGMGIDKPDVRFVAHMDLPKSIEAYYQETGRAGRDGEPADAFLLYGLQDVVLLKQMVSNEHNEKQNRIENHKLDTMLAFCELTSCRRQAILNYFGEPAPDKCDYCDTCVTPPDTFDGTEVVQKALSAIYKTGQRFGANYVIDVLHGKETDRIFQFDHHYLSVFGIGKDLSYDEWRSVLRQLVVRGLVIVDVQGYNGLKLHESCRAILKGDEQIFLQKMLATQKSTQKKKTRRVDLTDLDYDELLFEKLREWRSDAAKAANLPPYTILHDASLKEIAAFKPQSESDLLNINGIGQAKLERYGHELLKLIE